MQRCLTGISDLDSYLLEFFDEKSLLKISQMSKYLAFLCSETREEFWKKRINKFFPNFLQYKGERSYKKFYFYLCSMFQKSDIKIKELYNKNYDCKSYVKNGFIEILKFIKDNDPEYTFKDKLVLLASENGHLNIIDFLYYNSVDIWYLNDKALEIAVRNEYLDIIKYLARHGQQISDNMLFREIIETQREDVFEALIEGGLDVERYDKTYVLQSICRVGNLEMLKCYHNNVTFNYDYLSLTEALRYPEMVKYMSDFEEFIIYKDDLAKLAVSKGYLETLKILIEKCDINIIDLLYIACENGGYEIFKFLYKKCKELESKDLDTEDLFLFACENKRIQIATFLNRKGVKISKEKFHHISEEIKFWLGLDEK